MSLFDEYIEALGSDQASQQFRQAMARRVLIEKLADLAQVLASSERLAAHGVSLELSVDTLAIIADNTPVANWVIDDDVLRLVWAGRDITTDNVKSAARTTAVVLARLCPDLLPQPRPNEPAPAPAKIKNAGSVSNSGYYNFAALQLD